MAIKIFGWALLLAGIIIIGWTLFSSYNIFTAKTTAPEIFATEEKTEIVAPEAEIEILDIQVKIEKMIGEIVPPDLIPKILNLVSWSIFAFILIFGGAQISGLGIKLIKK